MFKVLQFKVLRIHSFATASRHFRMEEVEFRNKLIIVVFPDTSHLILSNKSYLSCF